MMIRLDRMDLDDVGGNPILLARAVVDQIKELKPPVPVREIAEALDIDEIREELLDGLEGCLITPDHKGNGKILIRSDCSEKRKRFTISHELGHYLNPYHNPQAGGGFQCAARDMAAERFDKGNRAVQMEVEANQFASELLMPSSLLKQAMSHMTGVDLGHIIQLSDRFQVSRESVARRYVNAVDEPIALVFSRDGVIRYVKAAEGFPRLNCWNKQQLPVGSQSAKSCDLIGAVSDWHEVDGYHWLSEGLGQIVCEQTLRQENGFRMTLLALADPPDDVELEDEWRAPSFAKR
ncbi:MAG: ImmA/IrrE family metallo-endopeptidase [Pseudomonadota bacterium]